jgi:acetyl-CoA carboxylase carboxyl transferase subunit alpha
VDLVIPEPLGGAHRNVDDMAARLKQILTSELQALKKLPVDALIERRYQKFMAMGACD